MKKNSLGDIVLGLAAFICVLAVAFVVRRELSTPQPAAMSNAPKSIQNGAAIAAIGHVSGSPEAPVRLVEFSDFQCPFCARMQQTFQELISRHPGQVAIVFRHYPLSIHYSAFPASIAAECAADQGRFDAYAKLLFQKQDSLGLISWEQLAKQAGIPDTSRFRVCRADPRVRARVQADVSAGASVGIHGTPAIIYGDQMIVGAISIDTLEAFVHLAGRRPTTH